MADGSGLCVAGVSFGFGSGPPVLSAVDLEVARGAVLSLLGPSGCGKTSLLRVIAGLEAPSDGTVSIEGRQLSGPGVLVAPEGRRVGMVFQDWALFPHLDVAANVAFGLPRELRRDGTQVADTLDLVGLGGLAGRRPDQLSGGQQQRVALARALAQRPDVLLLDEPFSNLDATLRRQVRTDVHRLLTEIGLTTVIVTHDRDEAFALADRVALMREGTVVDEGRAEELYLRPRDEWAARFVGEANLLEGSAHGEVATTVLGSIRLDRSVQGPVRVLVRPEQVELRGGEGRATVALVEYHGPRTSYVVRVAGESLVAEVPGPAHFSAGDRVGLAVVLDAAPAFPAP